ncbi:hypothetical protein LF817_17560 [Halobacillus sp. A1]|uniref:hypothetical protein n=1 Tax=Halobacillus sp. A1 TaxID=2880262 RepID=UPI0020A6D61D|nr:hypothetical protein [Halobacillus sp. A1]MCP3033135.1 hypothetical protein [Halobacillus sp. A1]
MKSRLVWAFAATILYPIVWILLSLLLKGEPPNGNAITGSAIGGFLSGFLFAPSIQTRRSKEC